MQFLPTKAKYANYLLLGLYISLISQQITIAKQILLLHLACQGHQRKLMASKKREKKKETTRDL